MVRTAPLYPDTLELCLVFRLTFLYALAYTGRAHGDRRLLQLPVEVICLQSHFSHSLSPPALA